MENLPVAKRDYIPLTLFSLSFLLKNVETKESVKEVVAEGGANFPLTVKFDQVSKFRQDIQNCGWEILIAEIILLIGQPRVHVQLLRALASQLDVQDIQKRKSLRKNLSVLNVLQRDPATTGIAR